MSKGTVVILGAGGHAKGLVEALRPMGYKTIWFLDDAPVNLPLVKGRIDGANLREMATQGVEGFIVGIGSVNAAGCALRDKFYAQALAAGLRPVSAFAPAAVVLGHVGEGVFVGPGAIVMVGAIVGNNSIINSGAIVEHDCQVGWSSHVASGAVLCGGVVLGKQVHVGAGAVVKQGVKIGDGATVGMGAVVLEDVRAGFTVVGNPARYRREISVEGEENMETLLMVGGTGIPSKPWALRITKNNAPVGYEVFATQDEAEAYRVSPELVGKYGLQAQRKAA